MYSGRVSEISRPALRTKEDRHVETRLPPGPRSPALWQSLRYLVRPDELFDECYRHYGDIFTLRLVGSGTWVFVASPTLARELFTASPEVLQAGVMNYSVWGAIGGGNTVFMLDGSKHLERRRLMLPPFNGENLLARIEDMSEVTERVISSWPDDRTFPLQPEMQRITLGVLVRTTFGRKIESENGELMKLLVRVTDEVVGSWLLLAPALQVDWGRYSPWGRILSLIKETDTALFDEVDRRRRTGDRDTDVLSMLLDARDESGKALEDSHIRDELVTMVMTGHDTTETELTWAFELILSHPHVLAKVREELELVIGDRVVNIDDLPKLKYLEAAINEALRIRPLAPHVAFRRLAKPYEIGGHYLPAGTIVSNAVRLLHRRPDLYENPLEFNPDRFMTDKVDPHKFAPFGGGTRRCLGMQFALWEMKVVLAMVLRRFDLALVGTPGKSVRSGFFIVPKRGVRVRAHARS